MISMNYQFILSNLSLVVSVTRMLLCKCIYYVSRTVIINIFSVTFYGLVGIATCVKSWRLRSRGLILYKGKLIFSPIKCPRAGVAQSI
jgi:hypothetical protein